MTIDWGHLKTPEELLEEKRQLVRQQRREAYGIESLPLYMEAQYEAAKTGQPADLTEWVAKVDEIVARYPMP
ncbi:hypothetical protein FDG94_gp073 [Pseudomonas phage SM1]|uniref:Uncharacterized protein n=2 Tax=Samunavirus TaxID=2560221 RepID=A0A0U3DK06_9CAUD|nr:hypothetical protein FDG94_gp073 [Pseudomonas phage SM1]UGC97084.1 hypothetical protein [Pseudomonas phage BHU-1]UGV19958.1 hypothetical protein [Pseudomonas phage Pa BHU-15]UIW13602.1 hypothetical protein [Pseudomonas phage Pa BHU-17]UVN14112.1 hypothetical protein FBPa45_0111 [Pseudomonas phage vB_PaeS_FBPa45]HBO9768490.1 hypothetical protein [Pseudomonas aeruginosa]